MISSSTLVNGAHSPALCVDDTGAKLCTVAYLDLKIIYMCLHVDDYSLHLKSSTCILHNLKLFIITATITSRHNRAENI